MAKLSTISEIPAGRGGSPSLPPHGPGLAQGWHGGGPDEPQKLPLTVYRIAMLTGLAAILMMFAGLVSAYIVRGMNVGWKPVDLPKSLWLSTVLLIGSSAALEKARRVLRAEDHAGYGKFLTLTTILGGAFVVAQIAAWLQLVARGVYMHGSPHSSFFYVFTGLHGVHVLGGLIALGWLVNNTRRGRPQDEWEAEKRVVLADTVALYWHFMDGLWVCLFALLLLWR